MRINFFLLIAIYLIANQVHALDSVYSFDKLDSYKSYTNAFLLENPRYVLYLSTMDICSKEFTSKDKKDFEYFAVPGMTNIWSGQYNDKGEAILIRGMLSTDESILRAVLVDHPQLISAIIENKKCFKSRPENIVYALGNFETAYELDQDIALKFLEAYKMKLGDEIYNFKLLQSKK